MFFSDKQAVYKLKIYDNQRINKVLIFYTANINSKTTRSSQGVQVLTDKKGSRMVALKELEEVKLVDADYYRTKKRMKTARRNKQPLI